MIIDYEITPDGILAFADDGDRVEFPMPEFERWLEEDNRLYHGMERPDEYETPTGRWSLESYWECAPQSMILDHLNQFAHETQAENETY